MKVTKVRIERTEGIMVRGLLGLILGIFIATGCQTGGGDNQSNTVALQTTPTDAPSATVGPVPPAECPAKFPPCTKENVPVICTASVYAGRPVKPSDRLIAWGSNSCIGLARLYQDACKNLMQPRLMGQVQCVPDISGGRCPPPQVKCASVMKPAICTANSYGREMLTQDQRLVATDSNECLARAKLKLEACRANLDPNLVSKIFCESPKTKKELKNPS